MGKRGPKPKLSTPTKLGHPTPPADLKTAERKAWESLVADLEDHGNLATTDAKLIELYARTYAKWMRISEQLDSEPLSLLNESTGGTRINPLLNAYNNLLGKLERLLLDCGLSPTNRKFQRAGDSAESNPWKGLVGAGDI